MIKLFPILFILLGHLASEDKRPNILLCLADNWAWPHASIYGDPVVKTPNFDRIAKSGTLFNQGYCQTPSCSPARSVLLTGQAMHRLGEAANLWGNFPENLSPFPGVLEQHGYTSALSQKGWGPGYYKGNYHKKSNPAGKVYKVYEDFMKDYEKTGYEKPFFFWYGAHLPHRPWTEMSKTKVDAQKVIVPPYLPNNNTVKEDIAKYYEEVQCFDQRVGEITADLEKRGLLENTIIIVMGDNGWQMPRGLAQVYDVGSRVSMAIAFPKHLPGGQISDAIISFEDFAPTLFEMVGIQDPAQRTGKSFKKLLEGKTKTHRDHLVLERERHANVRKGDLGYPVRAIRNKDHLFVFNLTPDRWPGGEPDYHYAVGPYGDVDPSPTKELVTAAEASLFFKLAFGKRPSFELYDMKHDPWQMNNIASSHPELVENYKKQLMQHMQKNQDPILKDLNHFNHFPYLGKRPKHLR